MKGVFTLGGIDRRRLRAGPAKIEADARLTAAAPDLLAALRKVGPYVSLDDLDMVRAAIAKAEGVS